MDDASSTSSDRRVADALRSGLSVLRAVVLLACLGNAFALQPPGSPASSSTVSGAEAGPRWGELSSAQRSLLTPIQREWPTMDARRKQKWLQMAGRLATVGPAERDRIQARMTEWANLSPQQRSQMRLRYQEARQVAPQSRQDRWAAYQALPPEEREKLVSRASHAVHPASGAVGTERARRRQSAGVVTPKVVAPAVIQAQPGATTTLMSRRAAPPLHQPVEGPRIVASPALVDSVTLLPRRGALRPLAPAGAGMPPHD